MHGGDEQLHHWASLGVTGRVSGVHWARKRPARSAAVVAAVSVTPVRLHVLVRAALAPTDALKWRQEFEQEAVTDV